jgi:energy-coupling factor transporter ATP-binding protein EcfA2
MSASLIGLVAERGIFQPRKKFSELAADHVAVDALSGSSRFETRARRAVVERGDAVAICGPRGCGKSSLIANLCAELPDTHIALRVPVIGADDPTSVSVMGAVALSQALGDLDIDESHREALERARSDRRTVAEEPTKVGGSLGGGPIPFGLNLELGTLREQVEQESLAVDRLGGLQRLIAILRERGRSPVFVLEDTEAVLGGDDRGRAEEFFSGPVAAFVGELDAPLLIAVQDVFVGTQSFARLADGMVRVDLPGITAVQISPALGRIVESRLAQHAEPRSADELMDGEAKQVLSGFYESNDSDLRATLATLQAACEASAEVGSELVGANAVREAAADWRKA